MSNNELAFFIGLFGSVHCIGMCGPLAFAIPFTGRSRWLLLWDKLLYQLGRVLSYATLGFIMGMVGKQLWLLGMQQAVSLFSGTLIILAALFRLFNIRSTIMKSYTGPFNRLMAFAINNKAGHLLIGILNGFLPCGFVYLALIGAVNTTSVFSSVQYMIFFGFGTLPLMLAATLSAGMFTAAFRNKINRIVPYFMLFLGVWFVLRGLSLDIPYLSPPQIGGPPICR